METKVFIIKEDVCALNHKSPEQVNDLLAKMHEYGDVVDYNSAFSEIQKEYQKIIDNLSYEYNLIKNQKLSPAEVRIINTCREYSEANTRVLREEKNKEIYALTEQNKVLEKQLSDIQSENEARIEKIKAILLGQKEQQTVTQ